MADKTPVTRSPVICAVATLAFGPTIGMCYANKGRLALIYLLLESVIILSGILIPARRLAAGGLILLRLIGAFQCFRAASKQQARPLAWFARPWVIVLIVVTLIGSAYYARTYCYEPFHYHGTGMAPAIKDGDYFILSKLAYASELPKRGDVVVATGSVGAYATRIIALPGEKLQLIDGIVYINDTPLNQVKTDDVEIEDRVQLGDELSKRTISQFIETMPEGKHYPILKDLNRPRKDSDKVYTVPDHTYFIMGDNRDNSLMGFARESDILGKATVILWNFHSHTLSNKTIE